MATHEPPLPIHRPDLDPSDLSALDEREQHHEVYAWAGLALYFAQVLEQAVLTLLFIARMANATITEFASADEFFGKHERKTLGALLDDVGKHVDLPSDLRQQAVSALARRNLVAHRYFSERLESLLTCDGRQTVVNELAESCGLFRDVADSLAELTFRFGERFGLTPEVVANEMALISAESRGEDDHA